MAAILQSLVRPTEFCSLVKFQFLGGKEKVCPPFDKSELSPSLKRCFELLNKTSRSFAGVIQALDVELRAGICIFYLVLRGLDTIEDDMTIPLTDKKPLLNDFYKKLEQKGWRFMGSGPNEKDKILLHEFEVVIEEFGNLKSEYREVISDITKRMGAGMAEFTDREILTKKDYDLYCHYVAGLVGIGLSRLFAASGLEHESVGEELDRANEMGLFLQKTNIIRDYREDLEDARQWYPKEVWSKYAPTLDALKLPENKDKALACLNELVTDALQHVPAVFAYLSNLKNQSVFNFCAIPQAMAVATLATCYNNHQVFLKNVKIRKGVAVSLFMRSTNMNEIYSIFDYYLAEIKTKLEQKDPSLSKIKMMLLQADRLLAEARANNKFTAERTLGVPVSDGIRLGIAIVLGTLLVQAVSRHSQRFY
eukprot:m.324092 g.324092  ORF g.324092 m.324092 type:complete len:422 (-) comp16540_c10_seq6:153-1418(-)